MALAISGVHASATSPPDGADQPYASVRIQTGIGELDLGNQAELERLLLSLSQAGHLGRFARSARSPSWIAGAFANGRLCGVVAVEVDGTPGSAAAALAIVPQWQRLGIGSALLQVAINRAAECGVPNLRIVFSRRNLAMRRLAARANARVDLAFNEIVAEIETGPCITDPR